jgi:putative transposase
MPRTARIVVPEVLHHITQRGNNKEDIFFVEDDRYVYLELLGAQGVKYGLRIDG